MSAAIPEPPKAAPAPVPAAPAPAAPARAWGWFADFAGGKDGRFFKITPDHVVPGSKPGYSMIKAPTIGQWAWNAVTLRHVWASPNTVWSAMALLMYVYAPYDLSPRGAAAAAPLSAAFFRERLPLWAAVTFGYTAFWHVCLYFLNMAERPFIANREYRVLKVLHNMAYSFSGVAIWVAFENVFAFLWATGRLPYLTDAAALAKPAGMLNFVAGLVLIPVWRDAHFYFAHRLLHYKPLYDQVHSLHHRNTDIEPFSGLCMHPIEHLCAWRGARAPQKLIPAPHPRAPSPPPFSRRLLRVHPAEPRLLCLALSLPVERRAPAHRPRRLAQRLRGPLPGRRLPLHAPPLL